LTTTSTARSKRSHASGSSSNFEDVRFLLGSFAMSEEPDEATKAYWLALGEFIDKFSDIEALTQLLLWQYAGVPMEIGRALFSGVRAKEAMSFIARISEVSPPHDENKPDREYVFTQLGIINDARNLIVHYGAEPAGRGVLVVTNWLTALTEERHLRTIPISPEILAHLTADLRKAEVHLVERHLRREKGLISPFSSADLALLHVSWRYTPPQPNPGPSTHRGKPQGKRPQRQSLRG
jgi:hypothetical protein